jgi:ATP-dependent Clp protease ATP-binding subunit ClpC
MLIQYEACSKCGEGNAFVYVTKTIDGKAVNEGLCLKCAYKLNLKPVNDFMRFYGISEEEIADISNDEILERIRLKQ